MLLPYMSEPATGSRMPSMSTGGAAMNATMKANSCCQQSWDHQDAKPTDIETVVSAVTHSQKDSQLDAPCWREIVDWFEIKQISKTIREMVELLFLCTLSRGMKDCCLTTLFSLGKASVCYESVTLRYICLPI